MPSPAVRTPIFQVPELCGRFHGPDVRVANLGGLDHSAKECRNRALLESIETAAPGAKHDVLVQVTGGNSGRDLARAAIEMQKTTGRKIDVVNLVSRSMSPFMKKELAKCSIVHEMDLDSRPITMAEMRRIAKELTGYEGPEDEILSVERYNLRDGYRAVVRQMAGDGLKPTHIFVPVGGGELLTEIAAEAEKVWGKDVPKIVGVTIPQNIFAHPDKDFIKNPGESPADKLVCGTSPFKELVRELVRRGIVELRVVRDKAILKEYHNLKDELGIPVEPSAATAFAGAAAYPLSPNDTVVVINTGEGLYDRKKVDKVWGRRLRRWWKPVAALLLGAALALGGNFVYNRWQEHEQVKQQLRIEKAVVDDLGEREMVGSAMRVNTGSLMGYTRENARSACRFLGKPKELCDNYTNEYDFTKLEIYFLSRIDGMSYDFITMQCRMELIENWKNGTYKPDELFYKYYPQCLQKGAEPVPPSCFGPITPHL